MYDDSAPMEEMPGSLLVPAPGTQSRPVIGRGRGMPSSDWLTVSTLYLRAEHYRGIQRICPGRNVLVTLLSCLA